jgi:hypothetical protein
MSENLKENQLDPQIPIKLKLYLTQKERQAYRLAANLVGKESISEYLGHAIQMYTAFLIKELHSKVAQSQPQEESSDVQNTTDQHT